MTGERQKSKCPVVFWSQTKTNITISVDLLLDDMKPIVKIKEKYISLEAYGFGSADSGPQKYYFDLNLYEAVDAEAYHSLKAVGKKLLFELIKKDQTIWWPRLIAQPQKPNWIQIDMARWIPHENDDADDDPSKKEYRDIRLDYPGIDAYLQKEELGYSKTHPKTIYLIFYNLCMFIGYLFIMIVLGVYYYRDGIVESQHDVWLSAGSAMKFFQLLQYLEVMHPLFGYTKGSPIYPFLQVTGRNFILFCMIDAESRMHTKPVVFLLFAIWASIECVRYPYYLMSLLQTEVYTLTWLRYTLWIPLYPLGTFCEGIIVLRNLPYFEETKRFTVTLPNKWNFTFCMCTFMRMYIVLALIPGFYFMMRYLAKTRSKKLKTISVDYYDEQEKED